MNPHLIRTKNFYDLPRGIAVHIFTFLPLTALLGAQLVSKRFYVLTNGKELKHCFFLSPPLSSLLPSTEVFLHPVFGRLNFSAYHSPKVIRIGEDLDSLSLYKAKVGKQFATYPALKNVVLRVLSGGIWSFSTEIKVENDDGVTVWDVINETTTFFKSYTKVSFADHFGLGVCEERGYDPKVLMQNYDFLDPKMSFPKILFLDRNSKNTIIADYEFNKFASLPLIKRPADWDISDNDTGENGYEMKVQVTYEIAPCIGSGEGGELVNAQEVEKSRETDLKDDESRKELSASALSTVGTESMDTADRNLSATVKECAPQGEKEMALESLGGASIQIGNTATVLESLTVEGHKIQDSDSYTSEESTCHVAGSTPLTYEIESGAIQVDPTPEKGVLSPIRDDTCEPSILNITLPQTLHKLKSDLPELNIHAGNEDDDNLDIASGKTWTVMEEESDDWEDAFA